MATRSPIEAMLRDAIRSRCPAGVMLDDYTDDPSMPVFDGGVVFKSGIEGARLSVFGERDHALLTSWVAMYSNVQVNRFRADLILECDANSGDGWLAIECDGFEFHDRTVAQASRDRHRDRSLMALGIPTIRFTGSEIHHDSDSCAVEVWSLVSRIQESIRRPMSDWQRGYDAASKKIGRNITLAFDLGRFEADWTSKSRGENNIFGLLSELG